MRHAEMNCELGYDRSLKICCTRNSPVSNFKCFYIENVKAIRQCEKISRVLYNNQHIMSNYAILISMPYFLLF